MKKILLLISLISTTFLLIAATRTNLRYSITRSLCIGCGECAVACPQDAIGFSEKRTEVIYTIDPDKCTGCGVCLRVCPEEAIRQTVTGSTTRRATECLARAAEDD